ncbi:copper ion binding protein [Paenibacillus sp. 1001270B_150601_E10]|uniref:copper ion binding protein n=1 Tax=Paenibacillus sp. 1001270B_150601_E10 TaxID=2787079 RepID=UPI00189F31DC|nr:copper ion binding protein [Paenibacillus sp. 1001270B_150601_E10]
MVTVTWKVDGMSCGHCKQSVEKAVQELGVKGEVSLEDKTVTLTYDENAVQADAIKEAIEDQGYDVVQA